MKKLALTLHITFSIAWLGAVVVFLVFAVTGLNTQNVQLARAMYMGMELSAWWVILPLCLASFSTGILQALVTRWGLFKHYWVITKLSMTLVATILLVLHMQPINELGKIAAGNSFSVTNAIEQRIQLVVDAGAAIILLLVITTISVYKPWANSSLTFLTTIKKQ